MTAARPLALALLAAALAPASGAASPADTPAALRVEAPAPADMSEETDAPARPPAWTPSLAAAGPGALPAAPGTPHTLFVNFDGAVLRRGCGNDSRYDCSTLADLFDGYVGPFIGTEAKRVAILESVRKDLRDFGVRATWRRPTDDAGYTMVLYGDIGDQDFAGIAPYVDCGNLWPNDTCFAGAFQGSNTGATVILQEAGHTWGLEHVNSPFDNLHPFVQQATPYFQDQCNKIVADTDLTETAGVCNLVHERYCDTGFQNSYQELLYLFGPAVPDTTAPKLTITSPSEGSYHVLPVDLPLYGEVEDEFEPQFYTTEIRQGEQVLYTGEAIRLDLRLKNPPAGEYDLIVSVEDEAGNRGSDRVRFTILPAGSEDPDTTGAPAETDSSDTGAESETEGDGSCRLAAPGSGLGALLLVLAARRRRR